MHPLLKRQLSKIFGKKPPPISIRALLPLVDSTYKGYDEDRGLISRSLDITSHEMSAANRELQQNLVELKKLKAVIENSFESVLITDTEGLISYVNPRWEKMTGFQSGDVVGKMTPRILNSGKQDGAFFKNLWGALKNGKDFRGECVNRRKDGTNYDFEMVIFPMRTAGVESYVEIGRDITEDKKATSKIKELDQIKNKFIQIVSHQLRTPLSVIRWNIESLLEEQLGPLKVEQKEFLRITHDANNQVIERIRDLLTAMDIEEGRTAVVPEQVSIETIWNGIIGDWRKRCDLKEMVCVYRPEKDPLPAIKGDGEKVREILDKLMDNAVAYTPKGGRVEARLEAAEGKIRFTISDTGIGIPQVEQSRVFTRFFRASNASAMKQDSSGLGLYISKHFIEQHGGKIGFTSSEGIGSTFWFELPTS